MEHRLAWDLSSWRQKPIQQQPTYNDQKQLTQVRASLKSYPPLVFSGEIERLKSQIARAAKGEVFLLQGGDCAERFKDCNEKSITAKLKILLQMSVILCYGAKKPVVRIGRMAGQYAKPRSNETESINGEVVPVFRGDNINSYEALMETRLANPKRLLQGYHLSALTLNYIRALTTGGFADLHYPSNWDLNFVAQSKHRDKYQKVVNSIKDAVAFMEALGNQNNNLNAVNFYTSHEGLILDYEEAMTSQDAFNNKFYNLGAHMLWIGDRTRQLDGAHIEYFRGIENPLGIKVGPSSKPSEMVEVIKKLNPRNQEGHITLITRFGEGKAKKHLPLLIDAIRKNNLNVCWSCDPMHGNTSKTEDNIKTRSFSSILNELTETSMVHQEQGSILGGVHFELTGENVTECTGGAQGITPGDLSKKYESYCDPRLNYSQSLEMAFLISSIIQKEVQQPSESH